MLQTTSLAKAAVHLLVAIAFLLFAIPAKGQCPEPTHPDYAPLMAFYNATNGPNWTNKTGWSGGAAGTSCDPCNGWYGVECTNGRVTSINLYNNNLSGSLPSELGQLSQLRSLYISNNQITGSMPSELGQLSQLAYLNLSSNQLSGTIPSELGNLQYLTYLSLHNNQLTGSIPSELGQLSQLAYLGLTSNQLSGTIPSELGNCQQLYYLYLSKNQLTGSIPSELGSLQYLTYLNLYDNQLTGSIPNELCSLQKLQFLFLSNNQITGTIPSEIYKLNSLISLGLSNNQLSGSIPNTIGQLSALKGFEAYNNQLTGLIPSSIGNIPNLQWLFLHNNQLNGAIPPELGNLQSLNTLYLNNNQLTGPIPGQLSNATNLKYLYLNNNQLSGCLSSNLMNLCGALSSANISNNPDLETQSWANFCSFGEGVCCGPSLYIDYQSLVSLYNATNGPGWTNQTGWAEGIANDDCDPCSWYGVTCTNGRVTGLSLQNNQLSGELPWQLLYLDQLTQLNLAQNQVTGSIPTFGGYFLSNLTELTLRDNQFTGSIPSSLGSLPNLQILALSNNQLSGKIPWELGKLSNLNVLLLHNNQLSGCVPRSLQNLCPNVGNRGTLNGNPDLETQSWSDFCNNDAGICCPDSTLHPDFLPLKALYESTNGQNWYYPAVNSWANGIMGDNCDPCTWYGVTCENGRVTRLNLVAQNMSGQLPSQIGGLDHLKFLDLSNNYLNGNIPTELGNLVQLDTLMLNYNQLTGNIPLELGNLSKVRRISIAYNQLSGNIPSELANLDSLRHLALTKNQLTGTIPTGLGSLNNLLYLYIGENQLTGEIPTSFGNLTQLTGLRMDYNQLSGSIPKELGNITNLKYLYLNNNQLSGCLHSNLLNLCPTLPHYNASISNNPDLAVQYWWQFCDNLMGVCCDDGYENPDKAALLDLYNATNGANWTNNSGWTEGGVTRCDPCGWYGVTCTNGRVTKLSLSNNNLIGEIPASLDDLTQLNYLNLSKNRLTGGIPGELGNLPFLRNMYLNDNQLSGCLPSNLKNICAQTSYYNVSIANNPELTTQFWYYFCYYSQGICCEDNTPHPDVPALVALYSATNGSGWTNDGGWKGGYYGDNCSPCNWGGITCENDRVVGINLNNNQLTGELPPEFMQLDSLKFLILSGNHIKGGIPTEIENLQSLQILDLDYNQLTDTIPNEIGNITSLRYIYLGHNELHGNIPPELGQLTNLSKLYLNNNHLSGNIPAELGDLPLQFMKLSSNYLSGCLPSNLLNICQTASPYNINISYNPNLENQSWPLFCENQIGICCEEGYEHPDLDALLALYYSTGGENWTNQSGWAEALAGEICDPCAFYGVTCTNGRVTGLDLNTNQLSGIVPLELLSLTYLTTLNLSQNQLTGNIPEQLGQLTNLTRLFLNHNQLTGGIPASIGSLDLADMNLSNNDLSGCLPTDLKNLCYPTIHYYYIYNNPNLETQSWSNFCRYSEGVCCDASVTHPDYAPLKDLYDNANGIRWYNQLGWANGTPCNVCEWQGVTCTNGRVTGLSLANNNLGSNLPASITQLTELQTLNLSNNILTGGLPPDIGNMDKLVTLNLSNNQISGEILPQVGDMESLVTLNLSRNELTGSIPVELANLNNLENLYLNVNFLTGCLQEGLSDLCTHVIAADISNNVGLATSLWASFCSTGDGVCCEPDINHPDYAPLMALYNATNGPSWTNKGGWQGSSDCDVCGWYGVTCTDGRVSALVLDNNNLQGFLPPEIEGLSQLQTLSLNNNGLIGNIPPEIGNLSNLITLDAYGNYFTGQVPAQLANLQNLQQFNLGNNRFSGCLPLSLLDLCPQITNGNLFGNTGLINQNWSNFCQTENGACCPDPQHPDYEALVALYNATNGPNWTNKTNWLTNCDPCTWYGVTCTNGRVTTLSLNNNKLNGQLPAALGSLSELRNLSMYLNTLNGALPSELGNMPQLSQLNLSNNSISGNIPSSLGNLGNLTQLILNGNRFTGSIPVELGSLSQLTHIYLNTNQLSGSIPSSLGSLGNLRYLNLRSNYLEGCVPVELQNLCPNVTGSNGNLSTNPDLDTQSWTNFCANNEGACAPAPCSDMVDLGTTPVAAGNYAAGLTLLSAGVVSAGTEALFEAGESITLQAGFHAEAGCTFTARIAPCTTAAAIANTSRTLPDNGTTSNNAQRQYELDLKAVPNPFSGQTTLQYTLPKASEVRMAIYDAQGRLVRTMDLGDQPQGTQSALFDAKELAPGFYYVQLSTGTATAVSKVVLVGQ